jgi:hypothetical protein
VAVGVPAVAVVVVLVAGEQLLPGVDGWVPAGQVRRGYAVDVLQVFGQCLDAAGIGAAGGRVKRPFGPVADAALPVLHAGLGGGDHGRHDRAVGVGVEGAGGGSW